MYSWRLDPNLSGTSDLDYLGQLALHLTDEISRDPNSSELYFRRAGAYLDSGRFQDAIDDYTKAIDHISVGRYLLQQSRHCPSLHGRL